jgi:hypothetical protein
MARATAMVRAIMAGRGREILPRDKQRKGRATAMVKERATISVLERPTRQHRRRIPQGTTMAQA